MSATFSLDRAASILRDGQGRRFDAPTRRWAEAASAADAPSEIVDAVAAASWLQRQSGHPLRIPVGVIGPRDASAEQYALAKTIGSGLASIGIAVICGGRHGIMEAVCQGVADAGGLSIGLLPDVGPELANPYATVVIPTGIGEARNALIARAALCLVVIGDRFGTLSEVALGRQFGKAVIGLAGAARVDGVQHVGAAQDALRLVARQMLAL